MGKHFNVDETDSIIADCIRRVYRRKKDWVGHKSIVRSLLRDRNGKRLVKEAFKRWKTSGRQESPGPEWRATPAGWASNMVQWFSQRITEANSEYDEEFSRKPEADGWAYRPRAISPFCIYTIRHTRDLKAIWQDGGKGEFEENSRWVTGSRLLAKAKHQGTRLPIVFAAADAGGGLLYHGFLTDVDVDETEPRTTFKFVGLEKIGGEHPKSSLQLKSANRPLSDDFIYPYAICLTPTFLKDK